MYQAIQLLIEAQTSQAQGMATLQKMVEQLGAKQVETLPGAKPSSRLTKQTPEDDVEAYLEVFERVATREGWPAAQWANIIAPFLTGDAQRAYQDLDSVRASDYQNVKKAILEVHGHNLATRAQRFNAWNYSSTEPVRSQLAQLRRLARRWLTGGDGPAVVDRVVLDKCVRALPPEAQRWAAQRSPTTIDDLAEALEAYQVAQQMKGTAPPHNRGKEARPERQPRSGTGNQTTPTASFRRAPLSAPFSREDWRCYSCGEKGHIFRNCPVGGEASMPTEPPVSGGCMLAACLASESSNEERLPVKVGDQDTWALLD